MKKPDSKVAHNRPTDKRTDVWSRDFISFWGPFFHFFRIKKKLNFFWKHHSVRTEKLQRKKVKKMLFFSEKLWFFGLKFECKYWVVGNRLLMAILWIGLFFSVLPTTCPINQPKSQICFTKITHRATSL